jgi:peroxiredoxin
MAPEVVVLAVASLGPGRMVSFRRDTHTTFPMLFDAYGNVASRYRSVACPRSWIIDEEGRIRYSSRPREGCPATIRALRENLNLVE